VRTAIGIYFEYHTTIPLPKLPPWTPTNLYKPTFNWLNPKPVSFAFIAVGSGFDIYFIRH
jgi:hypothetical protein